MGRKFWLGLITFLGMTSWAWADAVPAKIDSGDTTWVLVSAALVMLMTPGLAFFYCGMVARKHVLGTIMQSYALLAVITVQWVLIGYSLAFGPDVGSVIGTLAWFGLKGVGAAQIARGVELPDLAGDIALEQADPHQQAGQGRQEGGLEVHQEMADGHGDRADGDGAGAAEKSVGEKPAGEGCQIHKPGVEAEDHRRQGGRGQVTGEMLDARPEGLKGDHMFHMAGQQQLLAHVEHQQGLHAVVGEPLPGLGEDQIAEPDRVTEEVGLLRFDGHILNRRHGAPLGQTRRMVRRPAIVGP